MSKRPVPSREVVQENRFNRHEPASGRARGKLPITSAAALAAAFTALLPQLARADANIVPPAVPAAIQLKVPAEPFLLGHGVGTQNYVCSPSGNGVAFVLMTPQATLFDDENEQLTSHFFSPNPEEPNTNPVVVTDRAIASPGGIPGTRATAGVGWNRATPRSIPISSRLGRLPGCW